MQSGVTLLWALRSPCNLNCQYCYFGTIGGPYDPGTSLSRPGQLSHVGKQDLSLHDIRTFLSSCTPHIIRRVFLAGGEPLVWHGALEVIDTLKTCGCDVIVCTNGLPLQKDDMCHRLLTMRVDAVSISLDSFDATYNDHWRQDRRGQGWQGVVQGIQTLIRLRNARQQRTKIGIYSVITQQNIEHILPTGHFVADLGVDYYIVQPISLAPDHPLHDTLCLDDRHQAAFLNAITALQRAGLQIHLPHPTYLDRVQQTLSRHPLPHIHQCFGGRDLFFIEPDGSIWDCPSTSKIAATPTDHHRFLQGQSAATLFSPQWRCRNTTCQHFSQDCVNMWQLMAFDAILSENEAMHA